MRTALLFLFRSFYLTPYATTMLNVYAPLIAVVVVVLNSRRQEAL